MRYANTKKTTKTRQRKLKIYMPDTWDMFPELQSFPTPYELATLAMMQARHSPNETAAYNVRQAMFYFREAEMVVRNAPAAKEHARNLFAMLFELWPRDWEKALAAYPGDRREIDNLMLWHKYKFQDVLKHLWPEEGKSRNADKILPAFFLGLIDFAEKQGIEFPHASFFNKRPGETSAQAAKRLTERPYVSAHIARWLVTLRQRQKSANNRRPKGKKDDREQDF